MGSRLAVFCFRHSDNPLPEARDLVNYHPLPRSPATARRLPGRPTARRRPASAAGLGTHSTSAGTCRSPEPASLIRWSHPDGSLAPRGCPPALHFGDLRAGHGLPRPVSADRHSAYITATADAPRPQTSAGFHAAPARPLRRSPSYAPPATGPAHAQSARSSHSPSGARSVAPSMDASCVNVAKLCSTARRSRKASAQASYSSAFPLCSTSTPACRRAPRQPQVDCCPAARAGRRARGCFAPPARGRRCTSAPMASMCAASTAG